ncbi:MAG: hypothetical protein PF569_01595 [Candidatus Woesearchaeota archaeon]|jgi:16S rRNA (adenine1518-N6/adenine1519-N6)-dimethyltransferase|nr:hypothetical protein [Candidatus Woesearchaeota archaeon]
MEIKYDQHFLVDKEILKKTIEIANINNNDVIYEIGPGKGYLTKEILKCKPEKLISIEIDGSFDSELKKLKKHNKNFEYYFSDGVNEISNFNFTKIIANIPYAITEPLYKKILELKINCAILLHGKIFYDTIVGRQSKWNYLINAFYEIELIEEVNGNSFNPRTKTKSALVLIKLREELTNFEALVQELYYKKKRSTKNAIIFSLVDVLKSSKKEAKQIYESLEINDKTSSQLFENISNNDFCNIVNKLKNIVTD